MVTMKKFVALLLVVASLVSLVSVACARDAYDPEKLQFVVVAHDDEKGEIYTGVYALKTVAKLAKNDDMCECYLFESDALVPLKWEVVDGVVTFISAITGEVIATK